MRGCQCWIAHQIVWVKILLIVDGTMGGRNVQLRLHVNIRALLVGSNRWWNWCWWWGSQSSKRSIGFPCGNVEQVHHALRCLAVVICLRYWSRLRRSWRRWMIQSRTRRLLNNRSFCLHHKSLKRVGKNFEFGVLRVSRVEKLLFILVTDKLLHGTENETMILGETQVLKLTCHSSLEFPSWQELEHKFHSSVCCRN